MKHMRTALVAGIVVSVIAAVMVPAASAAAGKQQDKFSYTLTNVDLCGFNTTLTLSGVDNFWPVFDASGTLVAAKITHQEHDLYTAANGQSVAMHSANEYTQTLTPNPDGSFVMVATSRGLPEQIKTPNGPVLTKDVGIIQFLITFDSSGNVVSQTVSVEKGPHPLADSGFALFCQAVTTALS